MKKFTLICAAIFATLLVAAFAAITPVAATVRTNDSEGAKKTSEEKNLPRMLHFTGSDWCYWCKLMDHNVFEKEEWKKWAEKNIVFVTVDFPRDETKITDKEREQNEALLKKYRVRGFPTFVILSPDGKKEIGRTSCPGRDVTPAAFIEDVKKVLERSKFDIHNK